MKSETADQHAVVLSGGGSDGAYEVGVIKALTLGQCPATEYRPLEPSIYTGASVGAYNAAVLAACGGVPPAEAPEHLAWLWRNRIAERPGKGNGVYRLRLAPLELLDPRHLSWRSAGETIRELGEDFSTLAQLGLKATLDALRGPGSLQLEALDRVNLCSLMSLDPLLCLIRETVDLKAIRDSPKTLMIATTHSHSGLIRMFSNPDFMDPLGPLAIQASAAIPGIFPPVEVDGELYVDGSVAANTPMQPAMESGATVLHVIQGERSLHDIPVSPRDGTLQSFFHQWQLDWAKGAARGSYDGFRLNGLTQHLKAGPARGADYMQGFFDCCKMMNPFLYELSRRLETITIHLYQASKSTGGMGHLLDFSAGRIDELMELGYRDAVHHQCNQWCILPGQVPDWLRQGVPRFLQ